MLKILNESSPAGGRVASWEEDGMLEILYEVKIALKCDGCGKLSLYAGKSQWSQAEGLTNALNSARAAGWRTGPGWHFCQNCEVPEGDGGKGKINPDDPAGGLALEPGRDVENWVDALDDHDD